MRKKLVTFALCIVTTFAATTTVFATEITGEAGTSEEEGAEEAEREPSEEEYLNMIVRDTKLTREEVQTIANNAGCSMAVIYKAETSYLGGDQASQLRKIASGNGITPAQQLEQLTIDSMHAVVIDLNNIPEYNEAVQYTYTVDTATLNVNEQDQTGVSATLEATGPAVAINIAEYRWVAYDGKTQTWSVVSDWSKSNTIDYRPYTYGDYLLQGEVRSINDKDNVKTAYTSFTCHPQIKGKCQMPYTGEGGGYLIGVESYDNPGSTYSYELLVLDCTKLANGDPAPWIYTSGRQTVPGNNFWTIWQPQYGYYWTLFRVYDANGNLIDEDCYGFQNAQ